MCFQHLTMMNCITWFTEYRFAINYQTDLRAKCQKATQFNKLLIKNEPRGGVGGGGGGGGGGSATQKKMSNTAKLSIHI